MPDAPDFHHELSARRHAVFNLAIYAAGSAIMLLGYWGLVLGGVMTARVLWAVAAAGGFVMLFSLLMFLPLAVRGGTYRVTLSGGRLRVESPHWLFGRIFRLKLSDIARLVVRGTTDGPERHEVHAHDGRTFCLDDTFSGRRHLPADELFAAIRRRCPDVPLVTEP